MNLTVVIIGIVLWIMYKKGSGSLPSWLFKAIGIFLLIMLVRNMSAAYQFIFDESDNWWPLIKENAANFSKGLRELLQTMTDGGAKG